MDTIEIDKKIFTDFGNKVIEANKNYERWHNWFNTDDYKKSALHDLVELIKPTTQYIIKSGGVKTPEEDTTVKNVEKFKIIDEYKKIRSKEDKKHGNKAVKYDKALMYLFEIICECDVKGPVIMAEGDKKAAKCQYHLIEYPSVTSCLTITCFVDDNKMVGIHEALKKRVPGGGLKKLKDEITNKTVIKVSVAGHGDFWAYNDHGNELVTGEEYEKLSFEERSDYHIIDQHKEGFLKWLVNVLEVNVKAEYINDGQGDYLITWKNNEWKILFKQSSTKNYKEVEVKEAIEAEEELVVNETYTIKKEEVDSGGLLGSSLTPLNEGYNDLKKKLDGTLEDEDKEFSIEYRGKRRDFEIVEWNENEIRAKYTGD